MRLAAFCLLATALVIPSSVLANPPAIRSVVNAVTREARFSGGVVATLHYTVTSQIDRASTVVQVGTRTVQVHDEEDGESLTILLPLDLPAGSTTVLMSTRDGISAPYPIAVDAYAPSIYAPTRSLFDPYSSQFSCNTTAISGEIVSLFSTGLGIVDGDLNTSKVTVTVGGVPVDVLESKFSTSTYTPYRIRFAVPPGEGMRLVTLTIAGQKSNTVKLPVGRAMLHLTPGFLEGPATPGSIQLAYECSTGDFLPRPNQVEASPPDLPFSLAGISVKVKDAAGVERPAQLYGVAWSQVNYVVPAATAPGVATVTAFSGDSVIAEADLEIVNVAPSLLFYVQVVRVRDGVQTVEFGSPIDMGPDTDQVYLVMYGTGIRLRSSLAAVSAKIGGVDVPVEYAGAQSQSPGLDQVNMKLPRSLAGRGAVVLELTVEGKVAKAELSFR